MKIKLEAPGSPKLARKKVRGKGKSKGKGKRVRMPSKGKGKKKVRMPMGTESDDSDESDGFSGFYQRLDNASKNKSTKSRAVKHAFLLDSVKAQLKKDAPAIQELADKEAKKKAKKAKAAAKRKAKKVKAAEKKAKDAAKLDRLLGAQKRDDDAHEEKVDNGAMKTAMRNSAR